jgi:proteasome lid subunit RPN8/RPN11
MLFLDPNLNRALAEEALFSDPEECIGVFECEEFEGDFYITEIFPMHNAARNKKSGAKLPKNQFEKFSKLAPVLKKKNKFLGVYHSHPSGSAELSELDMYSGMLHKIFKLQIVVAISGKHSDKTKKTFWKNTPNGWEQEPIRTKKGYGPTI